MVDKESIEARHTQASQVYDQVTPPSNTLSEKSLYARYEVSASERARGKERERGRPPKCVMTRRPPPPTHTLSLSLSLYLPPSPPPSLLLLIRYHTLPVENDFSEVHDQVASLAAPAHTDLFGAQPCTLNPTPYTLPPSPRTLHPTPYTLHPTPYTLHPTQ